MNNLQEQRAKLEGLVNTQIDPASNLPINCRNCIHCERSYISTEFDKCMKSGGTYCEYIHRFTALHKHICYNYSSWAPRQKSIPELIGDRIRKMLDT